METARFFSFQPLTRQVKGVLTGGGLQWYRQKTPWCFFDFREIAFKGFGGDFAKRLLGVGGIWTKDSLVLTQPWHQGVFCPDHPNTKESFAQIIPLE